MSRPDIHPKTQIDDSGNDGYRGKRLLIGTPTTGTVRMEWVASRYNQTVPTNWSKTDMIEYMSSFVPLRYTVHDAQNLIVQACLQEGYEWLLLIEHDTMPPPDALMRFTEYMDKGDIPVVSGLYFTKSVPPEPMVYRGRGNHYFRKWTLGDKVWVDGVPTGMVLIHSRLLKAVYDDSPEYNVPNSNKMARRVFDTLSQTWFNEENGANETLASTSDLNFCTRVINGNYLAKAGFDKVAKMKYPYLIDTNIFAQHIAENGVQFPLQFPVEFAPTKGYKPKEVR
jgi:hypothetical protein